MRLLVCGGRAFNDPAAVFRILTQVHAKRPITLLIEGGARGADRHARAWAQQHGVAWITYAANWTKYGKAAGALRNGRMLREGQPDGVVAFPGGPGTADMVRQAKDAGVTVWRPLG